MKQEIKLGLLTLVGELQGAHVHVTVLGDGQRGQRPHCGRFVTTESEWMSLVEIVPVVDAAQEIGRHWRDQEGVNGALLDQLAKLTGPPKPDDGYDEYDKATWGSATGG